MSSQSLIDDHKYGAAVMLKQYNTVQYNVAADTLEDIVDKPVLSVVPTTAAHPDPARQALQDPFNVDLMKDELHNTVLALYSNVNAGAGVELRKHIGGNYCAEVRISIKGKVKKVVKKKKSSVVVKPPSTDTKKKKKTKKPKSTPPYAVPSGVKATVPEDRILQLLSGWGDKQAFNATSDIDHTSAVHMAAVTGDEETLKLLLDKKADVNVKDIQGRTPLFYAAMHGHRNCAAMLIIAGAEVDCINKYGNTPLYAAVRNEHLYLIDLLVMAGASIDIKNNDGQTPLDRAKYSELSKYIRNVAVRRKHVVEKHNAAIKEGKVQGELDKPPLRVTVWDVKTARQMATRLQRDLNTLRAAAKKAATVKKPAPKPTPKK